MTTNIVCIKFMLMKDITFSAGEGLIELARTEAATTNTGNR